MVWNIVPAFCGCLRDGWLHFLNIIFSGRMANNSYLVMAELAFLGITPGIELHHTQTFKQSFF